MADTINSSDPEQVLTRQQRAKRDTEGINAALRYIMREPELRLFVYWLLEETHQFQTSFTGNSQTFFKEGERNIGLKLMSRIHKECLDDYVSMIKEAQERKHNG